MVKKQGLTSMIFQKNIHGKTMKGEKRKDGTSGTRRDSPIVNRKADWP